MIRREIQLAGRPPQWLLISQVEHARLSGLMARHCLSQFSEDNRAELMQAVMHHDDGWASWEDDPTIDTEHHRPFAFYELPLAESLPIWSASIDAAGEFGPLAGATVAGHFRALIQASEKAHPPFAEDWQQQVSARQKKWFDQWQALAPQHHTSALAEHVLRWLQLLDVLSLWLCGNCPLQQEVHSEQPQDYQALEGTALETTLVGTSAGTAAMAPWRLDTSMLNLQAHGWLVPQRRYETTDELYAFQFELARPLRLPPVLPIAPSGS